MCVWLPTCFFFFLNASYSKLNLSPWQRDAAVVLIYSEMFEESEGAIKAL